MLKYRQISVCLIIWTVSFSIFFLQYLAFVRNCVPQVSGIEISESVSITFFALTIFNVLLLIFFYEIVSYGMSSAIWCFRLVSIIYGVVIIALAITVIALEDKEMDSISSKVWAALSTNQKQYFDNDEGNLKS